MKKYSHKIMMEDPLTPKKLNYMQKESIFLLSIGTFLEYFDLMIYVHMAVLLNELFFPKTDPYTASLLSAFAFCSTYVFRPIGALIFGWLGDHVGRKHTVVITSMLMACSCLIMTGLPTYVQIGITASWIVTICRIIQGMSAMGEVVGAELYLTETIKLPTQCAVVSLVKVFKTIGTVTALGIASLLTAYGFNWRIAFLIGACIALVGSAARKKLRETPEFADELRRLKKLSDAGAAKAGEDPVFDKNLFDRGKINKKTALAYLLIQFAGPVCFYFAYIHCANILKRSCGFSSEQIIHQNFIASLIDFIGSIGIVYLSLKIRPLKIIKAKCLVFLIITIVCVYLFATNISASAVLFAQALLLLFYCNDAPAVPIFYSYFPVLRRFSSVSLIYALSRSLMYPIASFGLVYFTEKLGHYGLLIIMLPVGIGFLWGVNYFQKLENAKPPETAPAKDVNAYKAAKESTTKPVNSNKKHSFV